MDSTIAKDFLFELTVGSLSRDSEARGWIDFREFCFEAESCLYIDDFLTVDNLFSNALSGVLLVLFGVNMLDDCGLGCVIATLDGVLLIKDFADGSVGGLF